MDERWLPVPGYEGYYEVSDHGRVRSVDRFITTRAGRDWSLKSKMLKPEVRRNTGYLMVGLSRGSAVNKQYIHRLVLLAFAGEPPPGAEACHENDVRDDNRFANLRWDTHLANVGDSITRGRHRSIGSYNGDKTHCHRGHEFDDTNTLIRPQGRSCKECRRIKERERYHAHKTP